MMLSEDKWDIEEKVKEWIVRAERVEVLRNEQTSELVYACGVCLLQETII